MKRFLCLLLSAFGAVALADEAAALDFVAERTPDGKPYIMITGEFLPDEDLRTFAQLVLETAAQNVSFNSPGGNIYKAMELGRLIRRLDLGTIAVRQLECASACALAFLGGTIRYAQPGSIGVHRSSFDLNLKTSTEDAVAAVQQVTADVMRFITEMGADPGLLEVALSYDSSDMRYLSGSEMEQYRVTTPPPAVAPDSAPSVEQVPIPTPRPDPPKVARRTTVPPTTAPSVPPTGYDEPFESDSNKPPDDETKQFVATVLAETEDVWNGVFQAEGLNYEEPTLTLFSGSVESGCGTVSTSTGPTYCPNDRKVYLDPTYFEQLDELGISGDFAEAFLIAREIGHHVQNLTGILAKLNELRRQTNDAQASQLSVRVELQADCFAGLWGHYTEKKGILEEGDLEEALNAAEQLGDDTMQKKSQGYAVPETFLHGTSQQRVTWFKRGFNSGKFADCDTFNNPE